MSRLLFALHYKSTHSSPGDYVSRIVSQCRANQTCFVTFMLYYLYIFFIFSSMIDDLLIGFGG